MIPGAMEIVLLLVIVAVFFGAGKLPEVMGSLGAGMKQFRDANDEAKRGIAEGERPPDA